VYQEALTNVARHAHASAVQTSLEEKDGYLLLTVKDNGDGFDSNEALTQNSWGLVGMRERAMMLQGDLKIERAKPNGTVVTLKVPMAQSTPQPL
jgi:signal transduction histidine kinase